LTQTALPSLIYQSDLTSAKSAE